MTEAFDRDELVKRAGGALQRDVASPAQATGIAHDICVLLEVLELRGDLKIASLHEQWTLLVHTRFPDLVAGRADDFIRLASSAGQLLGEEVAKLIALATDLHVLGMLGLGVPSELLAEGAAALRERISRQRQIKRSRPASFIRGLMDEATLNFLGCWALELLQAGGRLTTSVSAPREYDLV